MSHDRGFTHIAFSVRNLAASIDFYARFGGFVQVHDRTDQGSGSHVAWMADGLRPFALVLVEQPDGRDTPLGPFGHLGVACPSREDVDRLCAMAAAEGRLRAPPEDMGPPVGYWAFLSDPDGNTLELSFGQHVELATAPPG